MEFTKCMKLSVLVILYSFFKMATNKQLFAILHADKRKVQEFRYWLNLFVFAGYWKGHQTFPLCLTLQAAHRELVLCVLPLIFVNAFAEKIESKKTSPISRDHTNTAKQYTPESTVGPWKHSLLY